MGDRVSLVEHQSRKKLPMPIKQPLGPIVKSHSVESKAEDDTAMIEENEMIKEFIFPLK